MLKDFISLFFPNYCCTCDRVLVKGESWICTCCLYDLPQTDHHLRLDNESLHKLYGRVPVQYAMSAYYFKEGNKIQKLLHLLKYSDKPSLATFIGKQYGVTLKNNNNLLREFDIIIPVPLHKSKLQLRGYNQSSCFAEGLACSTGIPWSDLYLIRIKRTETQTKKGRTERMQNVSGAFCVPDSKWLSQKRVLLVDDVVTTGATLESCCDALLKGGAKYISIATIAVVAD